MKAHNIISAVFFVLCSAISLHAFFAVINGELSYFFSFALNTLAAYLNYPGFKAVFLKEKDNETNVG